MSWSAMIRAVGALEQAERLDCAYVRSIFALGESYAVLPLPVRNGTGETAEKEHVPTLRSLPDNITIDCATGESVLVARVVESVAVL